MNDHWKEAEFYLLLLSVRRSTFSASKFSDFRIILTAAPSHSYRTVAMLQLSSPITAAGPSPIKRDSPLSSLERLK